MTSVLIPLSIIVVACLIFVLGQRFIKYIERQQVRPENVQDSDAMAQRVIAEAFNTGRIVYGSRDKDGNVTMNSIDENGKVIPLTEEHNE